MNAQDKLEAAIGLVRACGYKVKGPFELKGPTSAGSGALKKLDNDMIEHVDLYDVSLKVGDDRDSHRVHVEMRRPYVIPKGTSGVGKAPHPPSYTEVVDALFDKAVEEASALLAKRRDHVHELDRALIEARQFR